MESAEELCIPALQDKDREMWVLSFRCEDFLLMFTVRMKSGGYYVIEQRFLFTRPEI